jgi:hypothetical protein
MLAGCKLLSGGGGGGAVDNQPPPTANLDIEVVQAVASSGIRCDGTFQYRLSPSGTVSGTGRRDTVTGESRGSVVSGIIGGTGANQQHACVHRAGTMGLALGTWSIDVAAPPGGAARCVKQLTGGQNTARFVIGGQGCS